MRRARCKSALAGAGLFLLAAFGAGQAHAQAADACDTLPAFEIADREWVSEAHREAVAALSLPFGSERNDALAAANATMEILAGEVERSHGRGTTLAMVRADWAMIARAADSQTYAAPAAAELRQSFALLLDAADTRAEADYLLYLTGAADMAASEVAAAIGRHREVAGNDVLQLAAIADYVRRVRPSPQDIVELGRLMRAVAAELQSGRGVYEADAMLLPALTETGMTGDAATLAATLAPDAIARLERTRARIEAAPGSYETDRDRACWVRDAVMAGINAAATGTTERARSEELLFWEGVEVALFAETRTDYAGASFGFAQILALKALDEARYRSLMRLFALTGLEIGTAQAPEVGGALWGGEIFASMLIPEVAAEFYGDAKRWSGAGSQTPPPARFEVLLRALRFEWASGNTASVDDAMAEAHALIQSHGQDIDPILRTLYHVLEAEIMEARLEDEAAANALARAIDTSLVEVADPFVRRGTSLDFLPYVDRLLADHLNGNFCTGCDAALAGSLAAWWTGRVAYAREASIYDNSFANLALDIWLSDAPAAAPLKESAWAELEHLVENFALSQSYKSGIDRLLAQFDKTSLATITPLAGEWWMAAEAFTEADPDRRRQLASGAVEEIASHSYELGATISFFTELDRYARRVARAGQGQLARVLFEEMLRLSEPGHDLADYQWLEPDDHARLQLARELAPAYARRARDAFSDGDLGAANAALDKAMDLMTRRLAQEWRAGNEQAALLFRQFRSALHLSAQLRFLLALSPQADRFPGIRDRAFADMQMAMLGETALTMQSSIRNRILEDDDLRAAIRNRDEAIDRLRRLEAVETLLPSRLPWAVEETRARTGAEIEAASAAVARQLTISEDFAALDPLTPAQVTQALRPSEAVAVFHAGTGTLYGFILRPGREPFMYTVRVGREELTGRIARLRQGASGFGAVDLANAAALHEALLGPAEAALAGVDHLIVVADGPLPGLPWAMLVAGEPSDAVIAADAVEAEGRGAVSLVSGGEAGGAADWSAQPWLIRKFPVSVAPSVASLVAQRAAIGGSRAAQPFLGVGDPVLRGGRAAETVEIASLFTRSGEIDLAALADLAPLPETAHELARLAEVLEATPDSLLLGQRATESELKARTLSDYRVIAFATHGILAGEVAGTVEPGLVLTPETAGEAGNDGYLALSEIMALKLDADLVILSACNTGGADGRPRAEWMSGLARGFISAGARRMLVTLWAIPSDPTTRLVTGTAAAHAGLADWPKALQASVVAMIDEPARPIDAHPASWAGFVMLGVGD